ncbi:MAG: DUF4864 domain-containing protein [Janthinobacterium lividum]
MRPALVALSLVAVLARPARAEDGPAAREVRRVIAAQIDAFGHDDADAAFGFAAPPIRARFGTAARFLAAVRSAYPVLVHPRSVAFSGLRQAGDGLVQNVEVVGPDGQGALASYDMEHEPDGRWLIAGCSLGRSERLEL